MSTLKGIFPTTKPTKQKNFIYENARNLRRNEHLSHANKGTEEAKPLQNSDKKGTTNKIDQQQELYTKSSSNLNKTNTSPKKLPLAVSNNTATKQRTKEYNSSHKSAPNMHRKALSDYNFSYKSCKNVKNKSKEKIKLKNQGIQTLNEDEINTLYSEGIVRYPSKKCLNYNNSIDKTEAIQQIDKVSKNEKNLSSREGKTQFLEKDTFHTTGPENSEILPSKIGTDTKLNKESSVSNKPVRLQNNKSNNTILPANYRKGVVPKYIRDRKEAQEIETKTKAELQDPSCPNGHVPLPDNERKETLRVLKKNYQDYVNELNMMPIKTDTLKSRRRKAEIEKQLNKLEEGIKVFSKPKVYVKMNA